MACSPQPPVSVPAAVAARAAEAEARLGEVARLIADIAEPAPTPEAGVTDLPPNLRAALFAWKTSHHPTH